MHSVRVLSQRGVETWDFPDPRGIPERKNCHNTAPQENGFYYSTTSFGIFYIHLLTDFLGFIFTSLVKMAFALF